LGHYRGSLFRTGGLIVVAIAAIGISMVIPVPGAGNAAFMLMIPISMISKRVERRAAQP
jgi:hypothetical protein